MAEFLLILIAFVPVAEVVSRNRSDRSMAHPVNGLWLAYLYFGVVQPYTAMEDWVDVFGYDLFVKTLAAFLGSGLMIIVGMRSRLAARLGRRAPVVAEDLHPWMLRRIGLLCILAGVAAIGYLAMSAGGVREFFSESRTKIDYENTSGYLLEMRLLPHVGLLLYIVGAARAGVAHRWQVAALVGLDLLWVVYIGSRSQLITVVAFSLFGYSLAQGKEPHRRMLVATLVALVVGVGFIAEYRDRFRNLTIEVADEDGEGVIDRSLRHYRGGAQGLGAKLGSEFGMTISMLNTVPEQVPHDWGFLLLEYLTRPIPRSKWPDKRYPEGEAWDRFHRTAGTATGTPNPVGLVQGPAPGLIGKYYYMWSWPGVAFGSFVTGTFVAFVWGYARKHSRLPQALLVCGFVMLGFAEMNNPLMLGYTWFLSTGLPLYVVLRVCRAKARADRPGMAWAGAATGARW